MTQKPSTYVLQGGLDEVSQALAVPRGRVIGVVNYESVPSGYGRTQGYERYDGRVGPTAAFSASQQDVAAAARDAARAAIQKVPGSGPVRGVAAFGGIRYAWRDNAAGSAGAMWKATAAGWSAVDLGFSADFTSGSIEIPQGTIVKGVTSGATATAKRVVLVSSDWKNGDAAGYLVLYGVNGAFVAGENLSFGTNADAATIAAAPIAQSFPAGGRYYTENSNFYGASNLKEMYGCNGAGQGFAFDGISVVFIRTGMVDDRPLRVRVYKKHLFFAFAGGSLQHSDTGEPLMWNPVYGAGEIAVGSDITDLTAAVDALHIFTQDQINTLTGSDATDWVLQPLSNEEGHGGIEHTAQIAGTPIYLDPGGFRSITATQAYGNFRIGSLVPQVQPTLLNKRASGALPVASVVAKAKDQYRVFYSDGSGMTIYFGRKNPEPMLFAYPMIVNCLCSQFSLAEGERIFAGGSDGYVYELDVGTSFDGQQIVAFIQLPWDNEGSPDVLKRWKKVIVEMTALPSATIGIMGEFDYSDGEQRSVPQQLFSVDGGGGIWDFSTWDAFFWSEPAQGRAEAYIEGQGENLSLIIGSTGAEMLGYTLNAIRKKFVVVGAKR